LIDSKRLNRDNHAKISTEKYGFLGDRRRGAPKKLENRADFDRLNWPE
jgi:hypothetical protein